MISNYLEPVADLFQQNADPDYGQKMQKYMRNLFPFFGITNPKRRELEKQFFKEYGLPKAEQLEEILTELWELNEREYQHFGMTLREKFVQLINKDFIDSFESKSIQRIKLRYDPLFKINREKMINPDSEIKKFSNIYGLNIGEMIEKNHMNNGENLSAKKIINDVAHRNGFSN